MAPPNNRRPGYSRRAQYGNFLGYVLALVGALIGVVVLIIASRNPGTGSGARAAADGVTAPLGHAAAAARAQGRNLFDILGGYVTSGSRVAALEKEVMVARVRNAEYAALAQENRHLKQLLAIAEQVPRPVATARLIGSTSSSARRIATFGAGRDRGVAVGMPVRSEMGLVGRVLETGERTSRILLVTDSESIIPARRAQDDVAVTISGRGDATMQARLVIQGVNPLKVGDALVASGSGGIFWPGTPIAVVSKLTPDGALVRPLSPPGATNYVIAQPAAADPAVPDAPPPAVKR